MLYVSPYATVGIILMGIMTLFTELSKLLSFHIIVNECIELHVIIL